MEAKKIYGISESMPASSSTFTSSSSASASSLQTEAENARLAYFQKVQLIVDSARKGVAEQRRGRYDKNQGNAKCAKCLKGYPL